MALSNSIEGIVIRDLALHPPPPPDPLPAADAAELPELSLEQQRELDGLLDVVILLALAAGGRTHVGGLAERTTISQKTLSHHLGHLRTAGLVFSQRSGKYIEYEAAEGCVRYQRQGGQFPLTVSARGAGW